MRIGVIGESICDTDSVKYLIHSILGSVPVESRFSRGSVTRKLEYNIKAIINRYDDISAVIIITDLDNKNCRKKVKEIKIAIGDLFDPSMIIQIAIQEIEAWYLAMPEAVEAAFPNIRPFPQIRSITDTIQNPKAELSRIFWRKFKRSYRETSDGPKIASKYQYNEKTVYHNRSLMRFIRKITSLIQ